MPARTAATASAAGSPPSLSIPAHVASQSKQDVAPVLASSSRSILQACPESSYSHGHGFTIGSVVRLSSNGVRRARGLAVYASFDQGVVVLDPSTQTATSSYSFSPSQHPITPPLVVQTAAKQATLICLASKGDDGKAEVHVWSQVRKSSSSDVDTHVEHLTCEVSPLARSLHPLLSGEVLVHQEDGTFTRLSMAETGKVQTVTSTLSLTPRTEARWTHHVSVFDRYASSTILQRYPAGKKAGATLIARLTSSSTQSSASKLRRSGRKSAMDLIDAQEGRSTFPQVEQGAHGDATLEIILATKEGFQLISATEILPLVHLKDAKEIRDVTLFHSGRLLICTSDGNIHSTSFHVNADSSVTLEEMSSIALPSLSQSNTQRHRLVSTQLVTSATALVVIAEPVVGTMSALLLDLDLACVLSHTEWAVKGVENVSSHRIAGSTLLILANRQDSSSKIATSLWALPYEISSGSHLRWALQSSSLTRKWVGLPAQKEKADEGERSRTQLLKEVQRIAANKKNQEAAASAIDDAFSKWQAKEITRLEAIWLASIEREVLHDGDASSDSDDDKATMQKTSVAKGNAGGAKTAPTPAYPVQFVSALVAHALPEAKGSDDSSATPASAGIYAKQTVHQLLTAHAISHNACPRLLSSLMEVEDWPATLLALRVVHDLPEIEIITVLKRVVDTEKTEQVKDRAVELGGKLTSFMDVFISLALNRSQLRFALRSCLEDVDEIFVVMDFLSSWLHRTQQYLFETVGLGAGASRGQKREEKKKLPQVKNVVTLLCDMLDTYFPLFLSTQSSHDRIKRLSRQINEQLSTYNHLLILRGPLAAFARLQADQERAAKAEATRRRLQDERDVQDEKLTSLRKAQKKAIQGGKNNNIIGEVGGGLGKGVLGEKSRRRQLYEENIAVGLYSLERLEL